MFDIQKIRKDFPILSRTVNGKPLVYFDNGATAQKPQQVIDAISHYYAYQNSNIQVLCHRTVPKPCQKYAGGQYDETRYVVIYWPCSTLPDTLFLGLRELSYLTSAFCTSEFGRSWSHRKIRRQC